MGKEKNSIVVKPVARKALTKVAVLRPQAGFQQSFLGSDADIVIGGGAAGAGKSYALLLEAARHVDNPDYGAVIFRRTLPMVRNEGGLWDSAAQIYPLLGAKPIASQLEWRFPSGASVRFSHLQHERNIYDHQGSQYPFIGFDELTHFTERQFLYLLTRNRSTCGVRPYIRATCNPDPDSWVARWIGWWIDGQSGYPIAERAGRKRYFKREAGDMLWADSQEELQGSVKSLAFVPGTLKDNPILRSSDPEYVANLLAQDPAIRAALLDGNWKHRFIDNSLVPREQVLGLWSSKVDGKWPRQPCYISCDVARYGRDLAVVMLWENMVLSAIEIYTKNSLSTLHETIEAWRRQYRVPRQHVVVDQDGVGGGLVDMGGYIGFSAAKPPIGGEAYANLKTQCYYKLAEAISIGTLGMDWRGRSKVDGREDDRLLLGGKSIRIQDVMAEEFNAIKRMPPDARSRFRINSKDAQKLILHGRSPDLLDALALRKYFSLQAPAASTAWG